MYYVDMYLTVVGERKRHELMQSPRLKHETDA